jgi:hypothetical protein
MCKLRFFADSICKGETLSISNRSKQRKIVSSTPLKIKRLSHVNFPQPLKRATRSGSESFVFCLKVCMFSITSGILTSQINPTTLALVRYDAATSFAARAKELDDDVRADTLVLSSSSDL